MRNVWFAWFNFVCLIFVIHAHLYAVPLDGVVYKIILLAVPVFAITAGYSWGSFLKRTKGEGGIYAVKMFALPYLFWSLVYYLANYVVLDVFIRGGEFSIPTFNELMSIVFLGAASFQLYFLSTLIEVCVVTVLLRGIVRSDICFNVIVAALGIGMAAFAELKLSGSETLHNFQFYVCWVIPNVCFGILLAIPRADFYKKRSTCMVVLLLMLVGLVLHAMLDRHISSILLSCAIVALTMFHPKVYAPQWLLDTAPYIMGIYLVHGLFDAAASELWKLLYAGRMPNVVAWPLALIVFYLSMAVVKLQRKIPVLKNFV